MGKKEKRDRIFIIHFQPLERFPPVINLLDYLANNTDKNIDVITTANTKESNLNSYFNKSANLKIRRTAGIIPGSPFRIVSYSKFYLYSLLLLVKKAPAVILYFETLSSWPALIYKQFKGNKVRLFLHCHEYTSPENYNDMWLVKKMHKMEKAMYPNSYDWISHTNEVRMEQFKKDHFLQSVNKAIFHIMPNYPPKSWRTVDTDIDKSEKKRLVFIGSLGFDTMYLKETVDWVVKNKQFFSLDIYAYNIDKKANDFLNSIADDAILYHQGCNYIELPEILRKYDIGLVLYKPYNYNHTNGISNKVFEYIACGLDVWFPKDNIYMLSLVREDYYPKIVGIDFTQLAEFDSAKAVNRNGLNYFSDNYFCERIYKEINSSIDSI